MNETPQAHMRKLFVTDGACQVLSGCLWRVLARRYRAFVLALSIGAPHLDHTYNAELTRLHHNLR